MDGTGKEHAYRQFCRMLSADMKAEHATAIPDAAIDRLAAEVREMEKFSRECGEKEYTDTDAAWERIDALVREAKEVLTYAKRGEER